MFQRFIVATDLSPASFTVVSCLADLKTYGAQHCLLLQCLSYASAASVALSYHTEPLEGVLGEQKAILEKQGFTVEARTVVGTPVQEIVRIAVEEDFSLIVMGAKGHSLIAGKLLGGVAFGVTSKSQIPVLVLPIDKKPGQDACEPITRCSFSDHVLFATDFSQVAERAFRYVQQLVAHGVRQVTLVHVLDRPEPPKDGLGDSETSARQRLDGMKARLLEQGASSVQAEVCLGVPFQEITRLVREREVHLVVMGTQGRSFVGELWLGSVSHDVVRHSVAPVLLIPARQG